MTGLVEWASVSVAFLALLGFVSATLFDADLASTKIFNVSLSAIAPILSFGVGALAALVKYVIDR